MANALNDYAILGIRTTIDFLKDVIGHPKFLAGQTTTSFINTYFAEWKGKEKTEDLERLALLAATFDSLDRSHTQRGIAAGQKADYSPWLSLGKWRIGGGR
jgi:acetyl/propionyl-CoA carboxylase alpha subunit